MIILLAIAVIAIALVVTGDDAPVTPRSAGAFAGPPAFVAGPVPAHVQEGIAFGEIAPGEVHVTAEILPPHVVESILHGEMEPPTG
jgi:hypothetical protein